MSVPFEILSVQKRADGIFVEWRTVADDGGILEEGNLFQPEEGETDEECVARCVAKVKKLRKMINEKAAERRAQKPEQQPTQELDLNKFKALEEVGMTTLLEKKRQAEEEFRASVKGSPKPKNQEDTDQ